MESICCAGLVLLHLGPGEEHADDLCLLVSYIAITASHFTLFF